jgi:TolA-binding protein
MCRALFPFLLLLIPAPSLAQTDDAERRLDKLEAQAKALQQEIERLRVDLKAPSRARRAAQPDDGSGVATSGDAGEAAYMVGYNLWERRRLFEAQKSLEAMAKKYPTHRRASYARNLAGRASLDNGKPATAAKLFLENYTSAPRGERAPDSLFYLGQALMKLGKPGDACKAYNELRKTYGASLRSFLREKLPAARSAAGCED